MKEDKAGTKVVLDTAGSVLPPPPDASAGKGNEKDIKSVASTTSHGTVAFVDPQEGTPAAMALAANAQIKVSKTDKFLSKLRGMKRPKFKSLNLIKQLKKHTKTRRKAHKNFKGKVIDGQHELYVITAGIMLGIKCSLSHAKEIHDADEMITLDAFNYVEKASFPALGSDEEPYPTPPHSLVRTFKFKTYAPRIFARLRSLCDVSTDSYMESICGNYNFLEFMSNSKSGQFFFYSHDGKYMLKTQTKEENKFMKCILPHYYRYLAENPHTLLVRFLGMHRIKMYHFRRKVHFVIMTSVFDTPEQIHTIYDLKGSLIGREATPKEKLNGGVLKDLDLLERTNSGEKVQLGEKKKAFLAQLDKDAKFLASLGIMDYSLLLGVHFRDRRPPVEIQAAVVPVGESVDGTAASCDTPPTRHGTSSRPNSINLSSKPSYTTGHSHSDTPLRRAQFAAEREKKEEGGELESARQLEVAQKGDSTAASQLLSSGASSVRSSGSSDLKPMTSEVVIQGGTVKDPKSAYLMTPIKVSESQRKQVDESEDSDVSDVSSMASSAADTDDTDGGSVQVDTETNYASDEGTATALLLNKKNAYSDTNGLRYPEGNRLSIILAAKDSSPVNSPENTNKISAKTSEKTSTALGGEEITYADASSGEHVQRQRAESTQVLAFGHHPWTARPDGGINSRTSDGRRGNEIYYCGVIDILQAYNMRKQSESIFKSFYQDTDKISSVNPDRYAARFTQFMDENIE